MGNYRQGQRKTTTQEGIKAFLEALATCGSLIEASRISGYERTWIYKLRKMSPCFDDQVMDALAEAKGHLEESLRRGALGMDYEIVTCEGRVVMVWYDERGEVVGNTLRGIGVSKAQAKERGWRYAPLKKFKRDTKAAEILLRAMDRRYRTNNTELTGPDGGPIETKNQNVLVVPDVQDPSTWGSGVEIVEED